MILDRTGSLVCFALLGLLGCRAETFGGEDPVIDPGALSVVGGTRLAGSLDTISAPWMAQMADTLSIGIDDAPATLAARVPGHPARFVMTLPATLPAGTHELTLRGTAGDRTPMGTITTGGFAALRYAAGSLYGGQAETQPLPQRMELAGVGAQVAGGASVVVVDAANAQIRQVGVTPLCCYGIGASYRTGTFLAYRGSGGWSWNRFSSTPTGATVDSVQLYGNWWPKHELAPGVYLGDEKSETFLASDSTTYAFLPNYFHPSRIAFSADGHWAVASHSTSVNGTLILDRTDGSYHWSAGWLRYSRPVFLRDGRLVLYGWREDPDFVPANYGPFGEYLAHVDPATGALLDSVRFADSGSPYDLPFASVASGWIVIPAWRQDHIELSIRDPGSLLEIAHPVSPTFANRCDGYNTIATLEDPARHRLYLVVNNCTGQVPIWTFQLPE